MNDWAFVIGAIICLTSGFVGYVKGLDDGQRKDNEEIEKMMIKIVQQFKKN